MKGVLSNKYVHIFRNTDGRIHGFCSCWLTIEYIIIMLPEQNCFKLEAKYLKRQKQIMELIGCMGK